MLKKSFALLILLNSINAFAHCPLVFKAENACLMLDQNIIYVYDVKAEHNGPYKDFKDSSIASVKSEGNNLKVDRVARGVYKINTEKFVKIIDIELLNNKKTVKLKLAEK
jgi:hypothetical protein